MNTINNYLNELFGYSIKHTTPQEHGEEICKDIEDENREQMEKDFDKKCGKLKDIEQDICESKNKIYYTNQLIADLMRNKNKCGKLHSICWDVINKRVSELRQDLNKYNNNLKDLQKFK